MGKKVFLDEVLAVVQASTDRMKKKSDSYIAMATTQKMRGDYKKAEVYYLRHKQFLDEYVDLLLLLDDIKSLNQY